MARPTYVDIPDTNVDLDSPAKASAVFTRLRNNINAARILTLPTQVTEQTTASGTYVTLATVVFFIPNVANYATIVRRIIADLSVKTTSGTATFRLRETVSLDLSTEVTTVSTTYEEKQPDMTIDAAWLSGLGSIRSFSIQGKTTAGTASMKSDERVSWYMEY